MSASSSGTERRTVATPTPPPVEKVADLIRNLTLYAGEGTLLDDARVAQRTGVLHEGFANEQRWFTIDVAGTSYTVTVERNPGFTGR
jgi:hypothetical protein